VFVYGAHTVEGAPAIAMELIGGETHEDKIKRGESIPIETAVRGSEGLSAGTGGGRLTGGILGAGRVGTSAQAGSQALVRAKVRPFEREPAKVLGCRA
jgi:hypothetical protein